MVLFFLLNPTTNLGAEEEIIALTEPSSDIVMSFTVSGLVTNIPVKEGTKVKAGDLLIELNATPLEARLQQITLEAENNIDVLVAKAELNQKRQDLIKLEYAFVKGAATKIEIEHAKLDVEISEYKILVSEHEQAINKLKKKETEGELKEYRLLSPIDGLVEELTVEVGEASKPSEHAVRVVKLNPLRVVTDIPLASFKRFAPGNKVTVKLPDDTKVIGKVVFRGAVADAASDTIGVQIEIDNPKNHHAGERVVLSFP